MPQLDALTYSSQYIALVISFIGVYVLSVNYVIPELVAAQKLRQKLNTIALLTEKLHTGKSQTDVLQTQKKPVIGLSQRSAAFEFEQLFQLEEAKAELSQTYQSLAKQNLLCYAKPIKPWLSSGLMAQMCQTLQQKKYCFSHQLRPSTDT